MSSIYAHEIEARRCRKCGQEIVLIRDQSGRDTACEPGMVPFWRDRCGRVALMMQNGEKVRGCLDGEPDEIVDVGRVEHWQMCRREEGVKE